MTEENVITLPDKETMLQRLVAVDGDSYLQDYFYPLLLKDAGKKLEPAGVVTMLTIAIYQFVNTELPPELAKTRIPAALETLMLVFADSYIDALIIDNERAATEAKEILDKVLEK